MRKLIKLLNEFSWCEEFLFAPEGSLADEAGFRVRRALSMLDLFFSVDTAFEASDWSEFRSIIAKAVSGPTPQEAEIRAEIYRVSQIEVDLYMEGILSLYYR